MIHFTCPCGNALFFENSVCLKCGTEVGYDPDSNTMVPVGGEFSRCANGISHAVCNWVIPSRFSPGLCYSCRLTRTTPNLYSPANVDAWHKMESAKRRVLYTLYRIGLYPREKSLDPDGLVFDFLNPAPDFPVFTGHLDGVITMNLLEADDAYRERERTLLHEPYRTLVGHFRHELGHYYWDRFFKGRQADDPVIGQLQALFGDESVDYSAALKVYHQQGPPSSWSISYITAYATSHPWEDWAEMWAQYLHILEGSETALNFGWKGEHIPIFSEPFEHDDLNAPDKATEVEFLSKLNEWARIAPALNEIAASLGQPGLYPFVFSQATVRKILFVHTMVKRTAARDR